MKIKRIFGNRNNALKTFPLSHLILLTLSILLILSIKGTFDSDINEVSDKSIIALIFTFFLSCIGPLITLHSDKKNKEKLNRIFQACAVIFGLIYFLIIYKVNNFFDLAYSQSLSYFGIMLIAALTIPLTIAIVYRNNQNKNWSSWMCLISSVITGAVAGSIVRGGISGALGSIEALFDVNINSDWYLYIGVISEILLAGSFTFNYYLILIEDIVTKKSDYKINPSRIRKIFGTYIFLPLAIIYLLIFGAYGIKILVTGVRPRGIIVWLGIGYFVLGFISIYLTHPDKNKALEIINKAIYISFILIALMMIGAISKRIEQYGITINRGLICYIISLIIIYSILSLIFQDKRLLSFISTVFILTILALYGPISASTLGFKSQLNRLHTLISSENLSLPLQQGNLKDVDGETVYDIMQTIDELTYNYKKEKIIGKIISYDYKATYRYNLHSEILSFLDGSETEKTPYNTWFYYRQDKTETSSIDINGYSKFYIFDKTGWIKNTLQLNLDNQKYEIDLSEHIDELLEKSSLYGDNDEQTHKQPALILEQDNYKLIISGFNGEKNALNNSIHFEDMEGYILVK